MLAEIAFDLKQPLLECRGAEEALAGAAEHAVAGESKSGVILGGGPGKVTLLGGFPEFLVAPDDRAHSEPGQHHIDREIGDARRAEERLGAG